MRDLLEYDVTVMAYDLSETHEKVAAIEENYDLDKCVTSEKQEVSKW